MSVKPRQVTIPIYDGDDFERLSELRREVAIAERKAASSEGAARRVGDELDDSVAAAQQAYDDFVDLAAERAEMWVLNPIGHSEFRKLLADHPPRKVEEDGKEVTHPEDRYYEVDTTTFPQALLEFIDPDDDEIRTVVEPDFGDLKGLRRRIKRLAAGEFESIWTAAYTLNRGGIADPKLVRYSPAEKKSDGT